MGPFSLQKWQASLSNFPMLLEGLGVTLIVAATGLALAMIIGVVFGVLSSSHWKVARFFARVYVEFFQNTPLLIQVFLLYNALPLIAPKAVIPVTVVGVMGVGFYHGAYIAEVVRAGIQSIHQGQIEAALSQGFSYIQAMRHVIIPQALRVVLPPLTNQAVVLIKNTSILAVIAGGDLMYRGDSYAGSVGNYGPTYVVVGLLYFALCYPLAVLTKKLEDRSEVHGNA